MQGWDPFQDSFRIVERFGARFRSDGTPEADDTTSAISPRADQFDDNDGLTIEIELPGVSVTDVRVCINDGTVVVEAERSFVRNGRNVMHLETPYGHMHREFQLPIRSLPAKALAEMRHGILRIFVPRVRQTHTEAILVQTKPDDAARGVAVHGVGVL